MKIKIDSIRPNPQQPRHVFDQAEMANLVASIEQVGLINAISVEDNGDETYTLIDSERRWRACKLAGLTEIEAYIKDSRNGNGKQLRLAESISANMQRSDMNVIEQARAIQDLFDHGYEILEVMKITGLSQGIIILRRELLGFSPVIQELFAKNKLAMNSSLIFAIKRMPKDENTDNLIARMASRNMTANKMLMQLSRIESGISNRGKKYAHLDSAQACEGALSMTANKNVPEALRGNVLPVCQRCGLESREICRNCPVTDLVDHWR